MPSSSSHDSRVGARYARPYRLPRDACASLDDAAGQPRPEDRYLKDFVHPGLELSREGRKAKAANVALPEAIFSDKGGILLGFLVELHTEECIHNIKAGQELGLTKITDNSLHVWQRIGWYFHQGIDLTSVMNDSDFVAAVDSKGRRCIRTVRRFDLTLAVIVLYRVADVLLGLVRYWVRRLL